MTLKSFWAHRKQNGWLLVEIALVAVLSFYFIDHCVVVGYDTYICRASGDFEKKHLVTGFVGNLPGAPASTDSASMFGPVYALRDHIRKLPEVQSVCITNRNRFFPNFLVPYHSTSSPTRNGRRNNRWGNLG